MKDAFGGIFTLQFVVVFMIIVNCFLAFSVNYTKAFRAKNEIRSIIEKYEGLTCCAMKQIEETLSANNYRLNEKQTCPKGYDLALDSNNTPRFCYRIEKVDSAGTSDDDKAYKGAYYSIITYVNINIPIFSNIFTSIGNIFNVNGETALIYSSGINHSGLDNQSMAQCKCSK